MKPDWTAVLQAALGGGPVTSLKVAHIQRLWAGYGSVSRLSFSLGGSQPQRLIAKQVDPPKGAGVSHDRKIRSYHVEAAFYEHAAPRLHAAAWPSAVPRPVRIEVEQPQHFLFLLTDITDTHPRECGSYDLEETKVALDWLAAFHAFWWEQPPPPGLWQDGCYWHLATRQDELRAIGGSWGQLKASADAIDAAICSAPPDCSSSGGGGDEEAAPRGRFRTLCHGDFKAANVVFSGDGGSCAAYDFQYCGEGYGVKDIVYMLCASCDEDVCQLHEAEVLDYYHQQLHKHLAARSPGGGGGGGEGSYTRQVMKRHFELALLDYVRFMAGWGFWGNAGWAQRRAKDILPRLPALLREQAAQREADGYVVE